MVTVTSVASQKMGTAPDRACLFDLFDFRDVPLAQGIADLQKLGKEYGFDTALLTSLPSALSKENSRTMWCDDAYWSRLAAV